MAERIGRMRFTLDVGLLSRRILTDIEATCWTNDMTIIMKPINNGWLSRKYAIEVKGPESKLQALDAAIKNTIKEFNDV